MLCNVVHSIFMAVMCINLASTSCFHAKDGVNALTLAIGGDCRDVGKLLVDEFNVPLVTKPPVSISSLKLMIMHTPIHLHACLYMLVYAALYVSVTMLHMHMHSLHAMYVAWKDIVSHCCCGE